MTLALSTYYRTSLNRGETMTTVAKEIDNIRAYLKIQLVMHDNEFRVVEQISDGLNDYLIPKLILQPLAENAIDHGIDVSENENPTLWLTIREEAEHIFFEIRDNGAGMTQEKADQILTYQSSGYGVRNVCDRIHVLYGEKGEMKIESTPGKGTRVFYPDSEEHGGEGVMKNDMKKRILSAHLALILLLMLWCGTYFETKESQRQMEQLKHLKVSLVQQCS